jgi:hypothetical protein
MALLPQAIRPGVIGVILFSVIAAAICGGVGTEASSLWPEVREYDTTIIKEPRKTTRQRPDVLHYSCESN